MKTLVSVIIATYNGKHFLEKCLPSIKQTNYDNFEVVLCDDNSTDETEKFLASICAADTRFRYIKNPHNMGASKTRNNAVKIAKGEILIFLDNDTEVEPDWILHLVEAIESSSEIGAVQSTLIDYNNRAAMQLSGIKLIPHTCWGIPLEQGKNPTQRDQQTKNIIALSAAMAVRKKVFDLIGGFDEVLAVYTEDLEFSLRIWLYGWRIVSCPQSVVYHWSKKIEDRKEMHATRENIYFHLAKNSFRTQVKNYQGQNIARYLPWLCLILAARALIRLKAGDTSALTGTIKGLGKSIVLLPSTLSARSAVQSNRKKTDREIFSQVFSSEPLLTIYKKYFT